MSNYGTFNKIFLVTIAYALVSDTDDERDESGNKMLKTK